MTNADAVLFRLWLGEQYEAATGNRDFISESFGDRLYRWVRRQEARGRDLRAEWLERARGDQ